MWFSHNGNSSNIKLLNDTDRVTTTTPLHHHWLNFYYWRQGTNITTPKQPQYLAAAVTFIPSAIIISAVCIHIHQTILLWPDDVTSCTKSTTFDADEDQRIHIQKKPCAMCVRWCFVNEPLPHGLLFARVCSVSCYQGTPSTMSYEGRWKIRQKWKIMNCKLKRQSH